MRQLLWSSVFVFLLAGGANASTQSLLEEHDACVDEARMLVAFGEEVIEPFLPTDNVHEAYPPVKTLIAKTRGAIESIRDECRAYEDLDRMMTSLLLLWDAYRLIAEGQWTEHDAMRVPPMGRCARSVV